MTIDEAKQTIRLSKTDTTHDNELLDAIDAAVEQVENDTDRVLINQQFKWTSDRFPKKRQPITLAHKPIVSIDSIAYTDTDEAAQTVDAADYSFNVGNRQVYLNYDVSWPSALCVQESVVVTYTAGYGTEPANVPKLIKRAVLLQVGKWFTDPVMESGEDFSHDAAYERIIRKILRTGYP